MKRITFLAIFTFIFLGCMTSCQKESSDADAVMEDSISGEKEALSEALDYINQSVDEQEPVDDEVEDSDENQNDEADENEETEDSENSDEGQDDSDEADDNDGSDNDQETDDSDENQDEADENEETEDSENSDEGQDDSDETDDNDESDNDEETEDSDGNQDQEDDSNESDSDEEVSGERGKDIVFISDVSVAAGIWKVTGIRSGERNFTTVDTIDPGRLFWPVTGTGLNEIKYIEISNGNLNILEDDAATVIYSFPLSNYKFESLAIDGLLVADLGQLATGETNSTLSMVLVNGKLHLGQPFNRKDRHEYQLIKM